MSTQDQPREGGTSRLEELAAEDGPLVTDQEDRYGTGDDPDAVDSVTGRPRPGANDPGAGISDVAGVAAAGGMSGGTGTPGMGVPLAEGAREQGADRAEVAGAPAADETDRPSGS